MINQRKILEEPTTSDGKFRVPTANFTTEDEVQWAIRRKASARDSQYQDTTCGPNPFTYDPQGAYLCGGRRDGTSAACNKLDGHECLIRIKPVGDPHHFSCAMYEMENAGDPEGRYAPAGKFDDKRIGAGSTKNDDGFGCVRCAESRPMPRPDSEGRTKFCILKGHTVEPNACCWDNEPITTTNTVVKTKATGLPWDGGEYASQARGER